MSMNWQPGSDAEIDVELRDDPEAGPGIGHPKGRFARTDGPLPDGESTTEGDAGNGTLPQGGADRRQRGRTGG